jgi:two-component system, chemotaxis family, chemotaxis protein CheY
MTHHNPTILLVDDSGVTRTMIRRVIGMTDLPVGTILEAADGAAGLALLESSDVELVLADLNMPGMDGFEMISRMRQDPRLLAIPIVVISAQPDTLQIDRLKRDGVAGYLAKPFTPEAVRDMVEPLLNLKRKEIEPPSDHSSGSFNLTLIEALGEALETMAFMSPQLPSKLEPPSLPDNRRLVRVDFEGHGIRGSLAIAASPAFGAAVAANCDNHPSPGEADDALKELANVTCGLLLRRRVGGGVGFKLAPPTMIESTEAEALFADDDVVSLDIDGHLVSAHVSSDVFLFAGEEKH